MLVDIVIPTYNNWSVLHHCLRSIEGEPDVGRIIVVDDMSSDGTVRQIRRGFPDVTIVQLPEHRGLAYALNRGVENGNSDHILFLNDDIIAMPGAVNVLLDVFSKSPNLIFAGGRLVDADTGKTQDQYRPRDLPTATSFVARITGLERIWPSNPWSGNHLRRPLPEDEATIIAMQPAGACLVVRRAALKQVGGWNEQFMFWYEDVDLVARLLELGPGVWEPRAIFYHLGGHSTRAWGKPEQHASLYNGMLRYAQEHLSKPGRVMVSFCVMCACGARVPYYVIRHDADSARIYASLAKGATRVIVGLDPGYTSVREN
jgi:N-acetylglucosaminyl-diphospho-decaprenol L-rhamnosyltransferase